MQLRTRSELGLEEGERERGGWARGAPRLLSRLMLIGVIVALAWVKGYSARSWALLALAVLWAAYLPSLLARSWRLLAASRLAGWQRIALFVLAVIVVLGGFALTVRWLVVPR